MQEEDSTRTYALATSLVRLVDVRTGNARSLSANVNGKLLDAERAIITDLYKIYVPTSR